jgi:hypothetical protein
MNMHGGGIGSSFHLSRPKGDPRLAERIEATRKCAVERSV